MIIFEKQVCHLMNKIRLCSWWFLECVCVCVCVCCCYSFPSERGTINQKDVSIKLHKDITTQAWFSAGEKRVLYYNGADACQIPASIQNGSGGCLFLPPKWFPKWVPRLCHRVTDAPSGHTKPHCSKAAESRWGCSNFCAFRGMMLEE